MDFNCEYNAPMYCDFEEDDNQSSPDLETYFDVDHEENKENSGENDGKKYKNIVRSWKSSDETSKKAVRTAARKIRISTPTGASLRNAVLKTIESVKNSPKVILTKRCPKRKSGANGLPRLTVSNTNAGVSRRRSSTGCAKSRPLSSHPDVFSRLASTKTKGKPLKALHSGVVDLQKMLRHYNPIEFKAKTVTKPETPLFSSKRQISRSSSSERVIPKYVSTAEAILKMTNEKPERFKSLPSNHRRTRSASPSIRRKNPIGSVVPKSPKLATALRQRPVVLSSAEINDREWEEIKKYKFKARAVNEGLPTSMMTTAKRSVVIEPRSVTIPEPFSFTKKGSSVSQKSKVPEPTFETGFKARPLCRKILTQTTGIPEKKILPPVVPESPHFSTTSSRRHRQRKDEKEGSNESVESGFSSHSETTSRIIKARPAPHVGIPYLPAPKSKVVTEIKPFSFDEGIEMAEQRKRERLKEILENERKERVFKATPLPPLDKPVNLPLKSVTLPTKTEPFNLEIEKRVETRLKRFEEEVESSLKRQKEATFFKARPHKNPSPFIPHPSDKVPVEALPLELHSDRRAGEREAFELLKKEREAELLEHKRRAEEEKSRQEELEVRRLRCDAVPKANPIRKYASVNIHGSEKPPTVSISPKFETTKRILSKRSQISSTITPT